MLSATPSTPAPCDFYSAASITRFIPKHYTQQTNTHQQFRQAIRSSSIYGREWVSVWLLFQMKLFLKTHVIYLLLIISSHCYFIFCVCSFVVMVSVAWLIHCWIVKLLGYDIGLW